MTATLAAAATYAAWMFAAGFILGTVRVLLLVPQIGALQAEAIEVPIMLVLAYLTARWQVTRHRVAGRVSTRLGMGVLAFAFLMLAEAALAVFGFGQSLSGFVGGYGDPQRWVGLSGQIAFALMPLLLLAGEGRR